jgi:geranylgeranyl diphosphate synthase type II
MADSTSETTPEFDAASAFFFDTLATYRELVLRRIRELIPTGRHQRTLYGPMLEYPLRDGKGFRPAICAAMCQACGGRLEDALDTAAALEMFHNAFLIHDDVADCSEFRRGLPTLHSQYGIGIATNVGDALNMLALRVLIGNTRALGLERALTIIEEISRMAQETTQGQAIELDWIRHPGRPLTGRDYLQMINGKTCWYTTIAPMRVGALIADVPPSRLGGFVPFGYRIGAAFQIQDDVLNLVGDDAYGKEIGGDIAEGKRTLIIIHALRNADPATRDRLEAIYRKERSDKTAEEIAFVLDSIHALDSIGYARSVALRLTLSAQRLFERRFGWLSPGPHRRFIEEMIRYMIDRRL